jgi:hypothetical protein
VNVLAVCTGCDLETVSLSESDASSLSGDIPSRDGWSAAQDLTLFE